MATSIFVNIPTSDLDRSKAFYQGLGYRINPMFSDDNAACVVLDENVYFMVLTREFFQTFTAKQVTEPKTHAQALIALTCDSREEVDAVLAKGLDAGGSEPRPATDLGFMYTRDIEDPDGNILEFFFMEPAAVEKGPDAFLSEQGAGAAATGA
ncbi:VOC family protein [Agromyces binzhouensis]|uniref:Glyoxalase n=1 Tax=Agromyces binzhouensis TaxID=1817495 RepID=A0A4Q2JU64_9MICO|nr:VOC family protein [Agromyces binzhouensis]RXZ49678.1 glyoxalase [Agromyces binzhouensis]